MTRKILATIALVFFTFLAKAQNEIIIKDYIKKFCGIAVEEMQRTGVPAAIKLAQGIHETMAGQSDLVQKSNNHFGIKCKEGYSGPYVLHDDDRRNEHFMKYEDAEQSYRDHSDFLKNRSRYASLFLLDPTDYSGWAYGLKKAGYATNPKYPQIIVKLIQKYNLEDYTLMGLGQLPFNDDVKMYFAKTTPPLINDSKEALVKVINYPEQDFLINKTKVIYVNAGTSLEEIAIKYKTSPAFLRNFNDLSSNEETLSKASLVFLQLKRTEGAKPYHEVQAGETIFDIAQAEGIRLESLLKYNNLTKFDSPAIGSKLKLTPTAIAIN